MQRPFEAEIPTELSPLASSTMERLPYISAPNQESPVQSRNSPHTRPYIPSDLNEILPLVRVDVLAIGKGLTSKRF